MTHKLFSIVSAQNGELRGTTTIPKELQDFLSPGANPLALVCPTGYCFVRQLVLDDINLCHHTILIDKEDTYKLIINGPELTLTFPLENNILLTTESGDTLTLDEGQYAISKIPISELTTTFQAGHSYSFITISYREHIFSKLVAAYPNFKILSRSDVANQATCFRFPLHFATLEMKTIIGQILNTRCIDSDLNLLIKKGQLLDLLIKVAEDQIQQNGHSQLSISRLDTEKILEAKKWLDLQIDRPITLFELSRKLGINVHKLSSCFLQITGSTVFNYHRKVRMKKAMELLLETDKSLFDIGTEVGYIDGKTFSKEFKKENNISPFEYRKRYRLPMA